MYQQKPKEKEENDFYPTKFKVIDTTNHYEETSYFCNAWGVSKTGSFSASSKRCW
jgi:hypothetical protein